MSAPIMSNSVAGGPSEPNKYPVDDSGLEIATGDPAAGGSTFVDSRAKASPYGERSCDS